MTKYAPKPIDTRSIALPPTLTELTERLAENTHDNWALGRLREGWRYGPHRDDSKREHPGLVFYDQLSETEKDFDRVTALETLKAILALGYQIEEPRSSGSSNLVDDTRGLASDLELKRALDPDAYVTASRHLLAMGEATSAYDLLLEAALNGIETPEIARLRAQTLLRLGAHARAEQELSRLFAEGDRSEETLGLMARVKKLLWEQALDDKTRRERLVAASAAYVSAYDATHGYWTGINAATLLLLGSEEARARDLADEVEAVCRAKLEAVGEVASEEHYWLWATLGEASLIRRDLPQAHQRYCAALATGKAGPGSLCGTRRNARIILEHHGDDPRWIDGCLPMPTVAFFVGHMIDQSERSSPRFPNSLVPAVGVALRGVLERNNVRLGFASAACGGDLIFLEQVLAIGGASHVVLPYPSDEFRVDSVDIVEEGDWVGRFGRALAAAQTLRIASPHRVPRGSAAYEYANRLLTGLARLEARRLNTRVVPIVVWDGQPGDGPGGTASVVDRCRALGLPLEQIRIDALRGQAFEVVAPAPTELDPTRSPAGPSDIRALLFADVTQFSKLTEAQTTAFVEHFWGAVGQVLKEKGWVPDLIKTWGDGLYLVANSLENVADFALDLCAMVTSTDWKAKGLPETLSIRIGLHAGPVASCRNPLTGEADFVGAHVSRAARIEPKTPPGEAYASEAFAALLAEADIQGFATEYVGKMQLPKGYGELPLYHLRRA